MDLPIRIIKGNEIKIKWGICNIDIYLMMYNRSIIPVYKELFDDKWIYMDFLELDLFELYFDYLNSKIDKLLFFIEDIKKIEDRKNGITLIQGMCLIERLGISDTALYDLLMTDHLKAYDFSYREVTFGDIDQFVCETNEKVIKATDFYFLESDIVEFEKIYLNTANDEISAFIDPSLKKLRHNQKSKLTAQKEATKIWDKFPDMTITDMVRTDEISSIIQKNGNMYSTKTYRNWVKELAPNRKPGRRPNKDK